MKMSSYKLCKNTSTGYQKLLCHQPLTQTFPAHVGTAIPNEASIPTQPVVANHVAPSELTERFKYLQQKHSTNEQTPWSPERKLVQ